MCLWFDWLCLKGNLCKNSINTLLKKKINLIFFFLADIEFVFHDFTLAKEEQTFLENTQEYNDDTGMMRESCELLLFKW